MIDRAAVLLIQSLQMAAVLWEGKECLSHSRIADSGVCQILDPTLVRRGYSIEGLAVRSKDGIQLRDVAAIPRRVGGGAAWIQWSSVGFE